jgi:hypothetical protein
MRMTLPAVRTAAALALLGRLQRLCRAGGGVRWTAGACILDRDALNHNLASVKDSLPPGVTCVAAPSRARPRIARARMCG